MGIEINNPFTFKSRIIFDNVSPLSGRNIRMFILYVNAIQKTKIEI